MYRRRPGTERQGGDASHGTGDFERLAIAPLSGVQTRGSGSGEKDVKTK